MAAMATMALLSPLHAWAQENPLPQEAPKKADIAITNLWAINSTPAPGGLVDFTVFYGNLGTSEPVTSVELKVAYDSKNLYDISLGDPANCLDDKTSVVCTFNTLSPGESNTVGFTARVVPTASPDTVIQFVASIKGDATENDVKNDFGSLSVTVTAVEKGGRMSANAPLSTGGEALEQAATKGSVWAFDVSNNPDWTTDSLTTAGLKFMIRGKEALAWTLNIKDSGFHNPAIQSTYLKVLSVVNSLFILGLLAIAAMWMFSLFIPRRILRQAIVLFGFSVVLVNFAFPLNQLLIDGSNLLQKTFLGNTNIADIVDTPGYTDPTAVSYRNEAGLLKQAAHRTLTLNSAADTETVAPDIVIGKLQQNLNSPAYTGTLTSIGTDGKLKTETIDLLSAGNDPVLRLKTGQALDLSEEKGFNPNEEHRLFAFLMMALTGLAYLAIALVFLLRIVILWALMIVSPVLFLLAIFPSTRGTFYAWLSVYGRWLLIGPLMALGLAIMVGIWKAVGIPIISNYPGFSQFGQSTNIGFYLPGSLTVNNLSTTPQMMQYLLFLTMLYLPILFAFALTRSKALGNVVSTIVERHEGRTSAAVAQLPAGAPMKSVTTLEKAKQLTSGISGFLGGGLAQRTQTALPGTLKAADARPGPLTQGISNLPEQLTFTPMRDMLSLAVGKGETRNVQGKAIDKLAKAPAMADSNERQSLMSIRQEIETRARGGEPEATKIINEIHDREKAVEVPSGMLSSGAPIEVNAKVEVPEGKAPAQPQELKQPQTMAPSEEEEEEEESEEATENETDQTKKPRKRRKTKTKNNETV